MSDSYDIANFVDVSERTRQYNSGRCGDDNFLDHHFSRVELECALND